ncbi:uncharacterized protein LOC124165096 isoform X2 [Ischnura elegans]|uniref:uncharacterized protein LOC124165096 isoform X2 n=1 Tax=Ischnura elegans TaxID=197161 RepID=UPI001ED8A485|nr:uncharacterized protein LOC124165096 isoform X2 [Ischnura elegans]XP_046398335.1 uncharacterized protein LOC124165096 isoform X2 [Ischnura elegans]
MVHKEDNRKKDRHMDADMSLSLVCEDEPLSEAQLMVIKKQEDEIKRVVSVLDRLHQTHTVVEKGQNVCALVPKDHPTIPKVPGRPILPNPATPPTAVVQEPPRVGQAFHQPQLPVPPLILSNAPANVRPVAAPNTYQLLMDRRLNLIVGAVTSPQPIPGTPVIQGTTTIAKTQLGASNMGGPMVIPQSAIVVSSEPGTCPMVQRVVKMTSAGGVPTVLNTQSSAQVPIMSQIPNPNAVVGTTASSRPIAPKYPIAVNIPPSPHVASPTPPSDSPSTPATASATASEENRPAQSQDQTKLNGKLFPSLLVTLKPCLQSKEFTTSVCTKLRSELDKELKKVLLLFPSELTEWLIQQGLIRAEQKCHTHLDSLFQPIPFKLGIYSDSSKFPNSGGYVWVSDCCGQRHLSVFSGSLFEGVPHTPKTMLKLIYHWACQTSPTNIAQWVQVDMNYIKSFNASMRAVCTCVVHEKLKALGGWQREVEVAIMTLGTSTNDGKLKQVKVEILGVLDKEKNLVRLLAVEPTKKTSNTPPSLKRDYNQILGPLMSWVDKKSIIVTDLSIDQSCLNELGFMNVRQTSPAAPSGRNLKIVEYLSTSIPRSFQNVLPMLNRVTIQQFLDEISWREKFGPSPMQAFKNLVTHIAELTKLELDHTMMALLNKISNDPFQNWEYKNLCKKPVVLPTPSPMVNVLPIPNPEPSDAPVSMIDRLPQSIRQVDTPPPLKKGRKRLADPEAPTAAPAPVEAPKKPRQQTVLQEYYYGRIKGRSKEELEKEEAELRAAAGANDPVEFQCCVCRRTFHNNLLFMRHLMKHTQNKGNVDPADDTPVCNYCLRTFVTPYILESHVKDAHIVKKGQLACRICNIEFFSSSKLIEHMHALHVELELPYSCKVCGYRSSMHRDVVDHFHELHDGSRKLQCPFCLQVVTLSGRGKLAVHNVFLFFQHIQKHVAQSPSNKCDKCILRFATKGNVLEHLARDHGSCKGKPGLTRLQFKGESIVMPVPDPAPTPAPLPSPALHRKPVVDLVAPGTSVAPTSRPSLPVAAGPNGKGKGQAAKGKYPTMDFSPLFGLPQEEIKIKKYDLGTVLRCYECKEDIYQEKHFMTNMTCLQCRFSTCCVKALQMHADEFHAPAEQKMLAEIKVEDGKKGKLAVAMYCICGFGSLSGNALATHLVKSECRTAYASVEASKELERQSASFPPLVTLDDQADQDPSDQMMKAYAERMTSSSSAASPAPAAGASAARTNGEPQSMLNILGLVRKPSTDESSNDAPDDDKDSSSLQDAD